MGGLGGESEGGSDDIMMKVWGVGEMWRLPFGILLTLAAGFRPGEPVWICRFLEYFAGYATAAMREDERERVGREKCGGSYATLHSQDKTCCAIDVRSWP